TIPHPPLVPLFPYTTLFRSLREVLALLSCVFFGALSTFTACAEEPSHTPAPFACEVRYHFREHFRHAKPGEKTVSAPSFKREGRSEEHTSELQSRFDIVCRL